VTPRLDYGNAVHYTITDRQIEPPRDGSDLAERPAAEHHRRTKTYPLVTGEMVDVITYIDPCNALHNRQPAYFVSLINRSVPHRSV